MPRARQKGWPLRNRGQRSVRGCGVLPGSLEAVFTAPQVAWGLLLEASGPKDRASSESGGGRSRDPKIRFVFFMVPGLSFPGRPCGLRKLRRQKVGLHHAWCQLCDKHSGHRGLETQKDPVSILANLRCGL